MVNHEQNELPKTVADQYQWIRNIISVVQKTARIIYKALREEDCKSGSRNVDILLE